ncbi:MAG: hypothetical protein QF609_10430 [Gammaproteobacteria bacterium]|nr:hypothetical protein [Gammaproteobacteria bacterium]
MFDGFVVKYGGSNSAFDGWSGRLIFVQQYDAYTPIARIGRILRQQGFGIGTTPNVGDSLQSQFGVDREAAGGVCVVRAQFLI